MWGVPPEVFASGDDEAAIQAAVSKLTHPEDFMAKVQDLYNHPEVASYDVLELKDGRTFERYSQPQRIDNVAVGRVWSFRDVTARRRAEEQGRALEREQAARAEAENSQRRTALLAEASRVLSSSFDYQTTLAALVRLTVPTLGDYCALDILVGEDSFERIGEAHVDPAAADQGSGDVPAKRADREPSSYPGRLDGPTGAGSGSHSRVHSGGVRGAVAGQNGRGSRTALPDLRSSRRFGQADWGSDSGDVGFGPALR